ncbi:MAG: alpha/beta hydrolase [Acaryochloris sp. RU_4_1]|nr:alpha/beta hydrolase [Acaryochloris sp. RU_4_1]NJR53972.1 alpha/beta hydrolase [Acaryochloris sp. CRU_2_0]
MSLSVITLAPTTGGSPAGLLVALHGWGSNAQDLASLAPYLNLPTYQFCFPNAPFPHPQVPEGLMWYDLGTQEGLPASRHALLDWLPALAQQTEVPLTRVILAGFSQGGAMTLDVGVRLPLAGLICLSGYLHPSVKPLLGEQTPPVLMVHGQQDPVVPLSAAQQADQALRTGGVSVEYHELPMAHEISPPVLVLIQTFVTTLLKT